MTALRALLPIAAAALTTTAADAATYTFSEADFLPGSMIVEAAAGPSGGQAASGAGGTYTVTTGTGATTYTAHFMTGASLDLVGETIEEIDFLIDFNVQSLQHAFGLVIEQGGTYFINYHLTGFVTGWDVLSVDDLVASNIIGIDGSGNGTGINPNFGAGADTLRFGFFTANSLSNGASVIYDNLSITVTTAPVPLPAGGALLLLGLGGLGLVRRRRKA
ncbi:VPLPA-CTERM sorting domain-containing protein [Pacificoceanicola onchidii]|uniref:VPLPA-CTERM sorting domain-containing protein n=1 Tax=Pacificoceanicola onchidii TaxID=2562685 RepID=UPI0010A56B4C|nr:VPLPA-CTERM sorting domain-containing protein [Pacificoceanicola onchidii]